MTCLRQPESQAGNGVHSRMVSYSPTDGVGGRELTELRTHHGRGTPGMASDTFTVEEVGQLVRKWFPPPPPENEWRRPVSQRSLRSRRRMFARCSALA